MDRPVIVLMGASGVGKTVVGVRLATRLGAAFIDADDYHPESNKRMMAAGRPLTDAERFPWLQALALEARRRRTAIPGSLLVIACSALRRTYRSFLVGELGRIVFVHLHAEPALIRARLDARTNHFMRASMLESQLATLEPLEKDEEGFVLDVATPIEVIIEQALAQLGLTPLSGYNDRMGPAEPPAG